MILLICDYDYRFNCSVIEEECCLGCAPPSGVICCTDVLYDLLIQVKTVFSRPEFQNITWFISDGNNNNNNITT